MEAIIHTGLHKTGSTSLQVFLSTRSEFLERYNIKYPSVFNIYGAHHRLPQLLLKSDFNTIEKEVCELIELSKKLNVLRLVFSSEDFEYISGESWQFLSELFKKHGINLLVITYIRPQIELIYSQYSQQIREGFIRESIDDYFDNAINHADYLKYIEILERQEKGTNKLKVRPYISFQSTRVDIVNDFLSILGVEKILDSVDFKFNKSLSYGQACAIREILKINEKFFEMPLVFKRKKLESFIENYNWPDNLAVPFNYLNQHILICRQKFKHENDLIAQKYLSKTDNFNDYYERILNKGVVNNADINFTTDLIYTINNDFLNYLKNEQF